ncbi:hypothetical protein KY084_05195 [Stakelama sp. CBK3Z-3]|uniref:Lipopolysaccharide biosynthesis protein n=1 Tax=Stakelama flava TaxID=2860338 RepID=A0ABS6XJA4_9SPHN|nr:O-unit flippase-like protein [Stakelama flava]MBW4330266.1 hypothetical protein [Stakelama flava]
MKIWMRARRSGAMIAGFAAQAAQYGSALLLLPMLFTRLSSEEIGIWYLFITIQGLVLIADFGFQPTFARNIALAHSGASDLHTEGISEAVHDEPNWGLLNELLLVARRIYFGLAALLFLILATFGLWYVSSIAAKSGLDVGYVSRSWLIFSFGACLGIYFQWISPLLIGTDRVQTNYIYLIIARGGFALTGIIALYFGGRLTALAVALVGADLLGRLSVYPVVRSILSRLHGFTISPGAFRHLFARVWPNASRQGIVGIASFLILRYSSFVVATFFGLEMMASYGVSLQLMSALQQIALLPITILLPQLVAAQVRRDRQTLRRRWYNSMVAYALLYCAGGLVLVIAGGPIISAIGANVAPLPRSLLLLLCVTMGLEGNHTLAASIIVSGNRVPFTVPAVVSGIAVAVLATSAAWAGLGVAGVLFAQGLVQLAYNNWKWPLLVYRETRP